MVLRNTVHPQDSGIAERPVLHSVDLPFEPRSYARVISESLSLLRQASTSQCMAPLPLEHKFNQAKSRIQLCPEEQWP